MEEERPAPSRARMRVDALRWVWKVESEVEGKEMVAEGRAMVWVVFREVGKYETGVNRGRTEKRRYRGYIALRSQPDRLLLRQGKAGGIDDMMVRHRLDTLGAIERRTHGRGESLYNTKFIDSRWRSMNLGRIVDCIRKRSSSRVRSEGFVPSSTRRMLSHTSVLHFDTPLPSL